MSTTCDECSGIGAICYLTADGPREIECERCDGTGTDPVADLADAKALVAELWNVIAGDGPDGGGGLDPDPCHLAEYLTPGTPEHALAERWTDELGLKVEREGEQ